MKIRFALKKDAAQLLAIYAPSIRDNAVSFETAVPSVKDFEARMERYTHTYPWLVAEHDGQLIAFAYASAYRDRAAYIWSCECSVYVREGFKRKGVAAALYAVLLELLRWQGFVNAYAVVTAPNPPSVKFHKANGFKSFAVYKKVGYKFGRWHDVQWLVKELNPHPANPKQPQPFSKVKSTSAVRKIIATHQLSLANN